MFKEKDELLIIIAYQKCTFTFKEEMSNKILIIYIVNINIFIRKIEHIRK